MSFRLITSPPVMMRLISQCGIFFSHLEAISVGDKSAQRRTFLN